MQYTFLEEPKHYQLSDFAGYINRLPLSAWRPQFPTLHNTGVPSLSQWLAMGETPRERWGSSLNHYYRMRGWHAGPHLVVCPDYIWVLSDLTAPGVSVSCWNSLTIGIEMVGNFEVGGDAFDSGVGAQVRDNASATIASLADHFGWKDLSDYQEGELGLHLHRECQRDHHSCPGSLVKKSDILLRIAGFRRIGATALPSPLCKPQHTDMKPGASEDIDLIREIQIALNSAGTKPELNANGVVDAVTRAAIIRFQSDHNLADDWVPGSRTRSLLNMPAPGAL